MQMLFHLRRISLKQALIRVLQKKVYILDREGCQR